MVIGDIHGGLKALQQVLAKCEITKKDKLIFLGDYVDGWSQSAQVIDYLMELEQQQECMFIKGNHDAWCEQWLQGELPFKEWLIHGGKETVDSYKNHSEEQKRNHCIFFNRMRSYYADDAKRLFIHAGFASMHGPEKERYESNYLWDRTLWEMALTVDKAIKKDSKLYPKRLLLYHEIYIGHTPTINYDIETPMQACNVWNIDTGAAFYGKLSVMDIETKQFWQSDKLPHIYINEKGRN